MLLENRRTSFLVRPDINDAICVDARLIGVIHGGRSAFHGSDHDLP
jgi:hypothetical protein